MDQSLKDLALGDAEKQWFVESRFGLFIHWGLYAIGARHEWLMSREEIAPEVYERYFELFDPDAYDPRLWAKRARAAGMKYAVLTTKHHEGFCLWDSAVTDYKATNTPSGRDLVAEYVEAFRAEGLKIGFYHSLIDWHHPDFPIDIFHPLRNHPDAARLNESRDVRRYADYLHAQVEELLTRYGKIDIMWYDFSYPGRSYKGLAGKGRNDWNSEKLLATTRRLQPGIIINNRLDLLDLPGFVPDIMTPEQYTPRVAPTVKGEPVTWEACHTFSGSWGYDRDEETWKDAEQLIKLLVGTVSLGGNLLMNVGPTARGLFDDRAVDALKVYEDWMTLNGEAIHGAGVADIEPPRDCRYTQKGNRLFLHIFSWPFRHIHIDAMDGKLEFARFLHDGSEVKWLTHSKDVDSNVGVTVPEGMITLELPVKKPNVTVPVVELILKD
ncbi:alpha-L-fucosidase [Martelella endophytica]|uniref:alpha-L-fucosidase n=1 Tax=Martelella endophytica TaxID=1486262 RepID=A0A0D5LVQ4_MAREN|nr:alpha-L-fucosidase [Martelella endophytica]AJY48096.1 alpha-L-fucosidase [Martelella endophytica]